MQILHKPQQWRAQAQKLQCCYKVVFCPHSARSSVLKQQSLHLIELYEQVNFAALPVALPQWCALIFIYLLLKIKVRIFNSFSIVYLPDSSLCGAAAPRLMCTSGCMQCVSAELSPDLRPETECQGWTLNTWIKGLTLKSKPLKKWPGGLCGTQSRLLCIWALH